MQPFKVVKWWNHIYFSGNSDGKQETKDSKRYHAASVRDAEKPRCYVAVWNAVWNRVKRNLGEAGSEPLSGELHCVHCRRWDTENGYRSCSQLWIAAPFSPWALECEFFPSAARLTEFIGGFLCSWHYAKNLTGACNYVFIAELPCKY